MRENDPLKADEQGTLLDGVCPQVVRMLGRQLEGLARVCFLTEDSGFSGAGNCQLEES